MKMPSPARKFAALCLFAAIAFVVCIALSESTRNAKDYRRLATLLQRLPIERVLAAAHRYSLELGLTNRPVPLREFTTRGYLLAKDTEALDDYQVFVYPTARDEMPGMFILQAKTQGGLIVACLNDGSIQTYSEERLDEHAKITGQQVMRANRDQGGRRRSTPRRRSIHRSAGFLKGLGLCPVRTDKP